MFVRNPKTALSLLNFIQIKTLRFPLFYLTLFLSCLANAQYTGVINANNPGFSESPYSVGLGVYQLESNLFFRNNAIEPVFSSPDSYGLNLQYRMSYFYEKLEFQANLAFQQDQIAFQNIFTSTYYKTGLSQFSLGAKYLLYEHQYKDKSKEIRSWKKRHAFDWSRLIPSVAILGGFNTNLVSPIHQKQSITGRAGFLFQNDINKNFNIITNVVYDFIGSNDTELNLVVSGTYSITDRWSIFAEYQNIFREFVNDVNFGSGLAYLFNRDLQINSSLRYLTEGAAKGVYGSLGFSFRLDRHIDAEIIFDDVGNPIRSKKDELKSLQDKKGVSKFFDKLNIFKKKEGKRKTVLSQKTIESIERNLNKDDKTLYQIRKEKGLPVRTRPKRVRVKPTKQRSVKKKKDRSLKDEARKKRQKEKDDKAKAKDAEKAKRKAEKEAAKKKREVDKKKKDENDGDDSNNNK